MSDAVEPLFDCRNDEVVPLGRVLLSNVTRDLADFADLLPTEYGKDFLPEFRARLSAAEAVVSSEAELGEAQLITQRVKTNLKLLPGLLDRLEARVRRLPAPTVLPAAFGIAEVRAARAAGDAERLEGRLKVLLQNISSNEAALKDKGQQPADTDRMRTLFQDLTADAAAQDVAVGTRKAATADNMATLNHLYALMQEVLADGKSLYRNTDKAKNADYTLSKLKKRVRLERKGNDAGTPPASA